MNAIEEQNLAAAARAVAEDDLRASRQLSSEGRGEVNDVQLAEIAVADVDDEAVTAAMHVTTASAKLRILCGELALR